MEIKRLFSHKFFLMLFVVLIVNGVLFYMEQEKEFQKISGRYEKCLEATVTGAYQKVEEWSEKVNKKSQEEAEREWILLRDEYIRREETEEWNEELMNLQLAVYLIGMQIREVGEYEETMQAVVRTAEEYLRMDIYSDESSFGYHNLKKTRYDYKKYAQLEVTAGNGKAVEAVLEYRYADYFVVVLMLILILGIMEEKKKGLCLITFGTPGGREKLAIRRCVALLIGAFFVTFVLYGALIAEALSLYGGSSALGQLVQSTSYFYGTTFMVSRGVFLFLYLVIHSLCTFALAMLFWLVFSVCRGKNSAVFIISALVALEYLCKVLCSNNGIFGVLKYFNIFSLIEPDFCMVGYFNLSFAGIAVDKVQILYALIVFVLIVICIMTVLFEGKKHPLCRELVLERVLERVKEKLRSLTGFFSLFAMELYKSLVIRRGYWIIIILGVLVASESHVTGVTYTQSQALYNQYLDSIDIQNGEGAKTYLTTIQEKVQSLKLQLVEAEERGDETSAVSWSLMLYQGLENEIEAGLVRKEALKQERDIDIWLLQEADYEALLGKRCISYQERFAIYTTVAVIFLQAGLFSFEKNQKMEKIIAGTSAGRKKLFIKKLVSAMVLTVVLGCIAYLPQLNSLYNGFGIEEWNAPIQSLDAFEEFPWVISIRTYLVLLCLYRIAMLEVVTLLVASISVWTSYRGSILCSMLIIIPHFMRMLGIEAVEPLSIISPIAYNKYLVDYGYGLRSFLPAVPWIVVCMVCIMVTYRKRNRNDERKG